MKIFKYQLNKITYGWTNLLLPLDSKILSVIWQDSEFGKGLMIYTAVYPKSPTIDVAYSFFIAPTGTSIPDGIRFISTVELPSKEIIHIFTGNITVT